MNSDTFANRNFSSNDGSKGNSRVEMGTRNISERVNQSNGGEGS